jgi:DNA-binding helix-hairpin-helix protein with protein kinase domain
MQDLPAATQHCAAVMHAGSVGPEGGPMPLPRRITMRLSIALALALGLLGAVSVAPSEPIAKVPVVTGAYWYITAVSYVG